MKKNRFIKSIIILFIPSLIIISGCTFFNKPATNIHLSKLFSDHMVLQRDHIVSVWGSADPGGIVTVASAGQQKTKAVSKDGNWQIDLQPMSAGGT